MIKYILTLCFIMVLALPALAQDKVFNATEYTLDNGLRVVVIPNHRAPVITHMVWYRTGAADEPAGKSGIAHFMEHLMFKGSLGFGPGEFSETIRALGGNDNAFTAQDYTAYFQSIASEHLGLVMRMEAGRMRGMSPPLSEVLSERDVILEERRQRTDNNPQAKFGEPLTASLFVNHPYANPVIGWAHEIAKLTWGDAKEFYDHHYGPNNAILVVSGDVEPEDVHALAKEIYGPLEKINVPPRNWTTSPPLPGDVILVSESKAVKQPIVSLAYRVPSTRQDKNVSLALQIAEHILGSGSTSRLYKSIVIDQKLASNINVFYSGSSWSDAQFKIAATPLPNTNPGDLDVAIKQAILKFIEDGATEDEVKDAINSLQNDAIYARDSLTGPAMIIGRELITGSSLDDIEYWPRDLAKITAKTVNEIAKQYLSLEGNRTVSGYLLPEMKIEEEVLE